MALNAAAQVQVTGGPLTSPARASFGIIRVFREMRSGAYDERALEHQLSQRGLMNRVLRRLTGRVSAPPTCIPSACSSGWGSMTVELGGLAASELDLSGSFWAWLEHINLNLLGFVIVGIFLTTWIVALSIWRLGRIEERWEARLESRSG